MVEKIGDYKLQYLNGSNIDEIVVSSNSVNSEKSNLKLVGYLYPGYGDEINQDLIDLLQNYARLLDEPTKALSGQIWYDRNNKQLKLRTKSDNDDFKWQVICKFVSSESDNFKNYGDFYWDEEHDNIKVWTKNDGWRFINFLTDSEREEVAYMVQNNTLRLLDNKYVKLEGYDEIYGKKVFYPDKNLSDYNPSMNPESLDRQTLIRLVNGDLVVQNGYIFGRTLYDKNGNDISTTYMKTDDYKYSGATGTINKAHKDHMGNIIYNTYATKAEVNSLLSNYMKSSTIEATYARKTDLNNYATKADLNNYVTWDSLESYFYNQQPSISHMEKINSGGNDFYYTAPRNGYLYIHTVGNNRTSEVYINNIIVFNSNWNATYGNNDNSFIPLKSGDYVYKHGVATLYFIY